MTRAELIAAHGRKQVRRLVAHGSASGPQIAVLHIAMGKRRDWTAAEWCAKLAELDQCDMRLDDWLLLLQ